MSLFEGGKCNLLEHHRKSYFGYYASWDIIIKLSSWGKTAERNRNGTQEELYDKKKCVYKIDRYVRIYPSLTHMSDRYNGTYIIK